MKLLKYDSWPPHEKIPEKLWNPDQVRDTLTEIA